MFEPTRTNCTIDGHPAKTMFDRLDWSKRKWRETSTLFASLVGDDNAPHDPHWDVPHIEGDSFHRVREKRRSRPSPKGE